ncbi:MAG: gliding motility protein GldC [Flavobacteriales bacterium]|nr:gliding motility protein GldC [Flavobacteriales bacterium]
MAIESKSKITFEVGLDENKIPEEIRWQAENEQEESEISAMLVSVWDKKTNNTLRIDLWTKEMLVNDMKKLYHQTLVSMGDALARATGDDQLAGDLKEFARYFGEEMQKRS